MPLGAKTEKFLQPDVYKRQLQGMSESEQNLFMDFLIQAGRNITSELHIERKGEEFND